MSEHPILFSGLMVRAILEGRKTQTRRVIKQQPSGRENFPPSAFSHPDTWYFRDGYYACPENDIGNYVKCPYGKPGDALWVRETFAWSGEVPEQRPGDPVYRADGAGPWEWRPSIHMPRWACRLLLRVTDVRVQRLQDISEADARAEGLVQPRHASWWGLDYGVDQPSMHGWTHGEAFGHIWDHLNGKREGCSWDANPWVWAVTFERVEQGATDA